MYIISIHAPVWGATTQSLRCRTALSISIHAPVWGATRVLRSRPKREGISIHAPVWGATPVFYHDRQARCDFNPRSRVGSDPNGYAVTK